MNNSDKIYVAGHRGLVGSAVCRKLASDGFKHVLTADHSELDLTQTVAVDAFFERQKPDHVVLAAAKVGGIHANDAYPAEFIRDNIMIQTNVIDSAYRNGVKKLLFLGSSCIYPKMAPQPMREQYLLTGPLEPTNEWYAVAKISGIKMGQAYRRQYGFNVVSGMPTNLYGPCDHFDLMNSHVLPALIRKFHLAKLAEQGDWGRIAADEKRFGKIPGDIFASLKAISAANGHAPPGNSAVFSEPSVVLWGSGTPRREFLHVDDLADAVLFVMNRYNDDEILNIGTGKDCTIRELAGMVNEVVGFRGGVSFDASKPDGTPQKRLDISRISSLGWQPSIELNRGIALTYDWYLKETSGEG
ncbi:MAG: GDP-L-fucose synthase [Desulfobacterales bacterium]